MSPGPGAQAKRMRPATLGGWCRNTSLSLRSGDSEASVLTPFPRASPGLSFCGPPRGRRAWSCTCSGLPSLPGLAVKPHPCVLHLSNYLRQGLLGGNPNYDRSFAAVPNLFGTRDRFRGRQVFHGQTGRGWGDGSSGNASDGGQQMKLPSLARCPPPAVRTSS